MELSSGIGSDANIRHQTRFQGGRCNARRRVSSASKTASSRWLRSKGYNVGDFYVQAGVGSAGGRMLVVIDDVAMPFEDARALDRGIVTLDEIAHHRSAC